MIMKAIFICDAMGNFIAVSFALFRIP